jgi:hypothetical protein
MQPVQLNAFDVADTHREGIDFQVSGRLQVHASEISRKSTGNTPQPPSVNQR